MKKIILLFVMLILGLSFVLGDTCVEDVDCAKGVCEDNLCVVECETDEDCVEPEICEEVRGVCEIGVVSCSDTDAIATDSNKVKGTRTLFYSDGSDSESTDSCFSSRDITQGLNEYWCGDGDWGADGIDCVATYGSGYVCSEGACIYNPPTVEVCNNLMDDDGDFTIDNTGGCDNDADGIIEYICGCVKGSRTTFSSYGGGSTCLQGMTAKCQDVSTRAFTTAICSSTTTSSKSLGGTYYNRDTDCTTAPARAAEVEEGFFAKIWNFLIFWN